MPDLGPVTVRSLPLPVATLIPISEYIINRGSHLGPVTVLDNQIVQADYVQPLTTYLVRQLSTVYRQLWPAHGQRFPQ